MSEKEKQDLFLAKDIMEPDLLTVGPTMKIADLAKFFEKNQIHGAPVVDSQGKALGVVSQSDLNHFLSKEVAAKRKISKDRRSFLNDYAFPCFCVSGDAEINVSGTVKEIMNENLVTCSEEATAGELAETMSKEGVQRVLITRGGELVGIVSASDLLRYVLRYENLTKYYKVLAKK